MQDANAHRTPRFYFALPRLLWWLVGGDARRSEKNGLEANAVGSLLHLVVYAFAFQVLLANRTLSAQLLLLLPLAFLVWLFWLNLIYANSRIIKLLRACGLMRDLPQSRAQGILIGIITTLFALHLLEARGWLAALGAVWIGAVTLNLIAAVLLALMGAVESSTN